MLEISPRITYSPEGILTVRTAVDVEDTLSKAYIGRRLDSLSKLNGYEVVEEGADAAIHVQVDQVVPTEAKFDRDLPAAVTLIQNLGLFTFFDTDDPRDGVFSVNLWDSTGAKGFVYPQFQRWLNAGSLDEDTAKRCIDAMAYPYGKDYARHARKAFRYWTNGKSIVAASEKLGFSVSSTSEEFRVIKFEDEPADRMYRIGEVDWKRPELPTIGNCACWSPSGEQRDRVNIDSLAGYLYEMDTHNADETVAQSLSLVLGATTLAYEAAKHPGTEDLLANAKWSNDAR